MKFFQDSKEKSIIRLKSIANIGLLSSFICISSSGCTLIDLAKMNENNLNLKKFEYRTSENLEERLNSSIRNPGKDTYVILIAGNDTQEEKSYGGRDDFFLPLHKIYATLLDKRILPENIFIFDIYSRINNYPSDGLASTVNIDKTIDRLNEISDENDKLMIAFNGHNMTGPEDSSMYLTDGNYHSSHLFDKLEKTRLKEVLLVIDTCKGKGFKRDFDYRYTTVNSSTIKITKGNGDTSFTSYFFEGLNGNADFNNDNLISIGEAYAYAKNAMKTAERDRGWPHSDPRISISIKGDMMTYDFFRR